VDYRIINRSGQTVWLHEQGTMMNDVEGRPLYWIGLAIDITESKRAELLERELALAQATAAKLESLDQAKDDLLAAVSHDFRSPLSSIIGFSLTLQRSLPTLEREEIEDFVERIVQNAWRLDRLVSDVLDVSRLREGQLELKLRMIDVGALVQEFVSQTPIDPAFPLELEIEPVTALVDPPMLLRVVDNLVMNAVRHNPKGAHIRVAVQRAVDGAAITVADDGAGIPPELEAELFEPFTSGPEVRHDPSPGLGLGLSIVQQIVLQHGGEIVAAGREPGAGACFTVTLPLQPAGEAQTEARS
jgi:two-component system sensor histidine kinase KdpD